MQNVFQGLPLRLLPEEVFTLWCHGLAEFVDERQSYLQRSGSTIPASLPADTASRSTHDHIALRTMSNGLPHYAPSSTRPDVAVNAEITVPSQISSDPTSYTKHAMDPRPLLLFEAGSRTQQRYAVFMHLWETTGFFLAPGMKFGGDYLLYREDPLICHATLIATVEDADKALPLADLASSARLSSTVQKQRLFCSLVNLEQPPSARVPSTLEATSPNGLQASSTDVLKFVIEWAGF